MLATHNINSQPKFPATMDYPIPNGVHAIPPAQLDLRPDPEIDEDILNPKPVSESEKNLWFYWHSGFLNMYPYTQRCVRAWHRRFSRQGWVVRVLDTVPGSRSNVDKFLDVTDPELFPKAFIEGTIEGNHAPQHRSDLVRLPLLLKYGGVYADAGMLQIGDLDKLWNDTIANPDSPFEVLSYNMEDRGLTNYFLCSGRNNAFFLRCHRLLLALWAEDGGKTSTEGMHSSPLLKGLRMLADDASDGFHDKLDNDKWYTKEEFSRMLTDYIIQGQAISMVMATVDAEDGWDGPEYCDKHLYAVDYMVGSQLINDMTAWDGRRAFDLMSLPLTKSGEEESTDQKQAREIVEACLKRSFGFKLATGMILRVMGPTLSSLWRENPGSDDVPGTYAHWLRYGLIHWCQDELPERKRFETMKPIKKGALEADDLPN